jgi:hypothetical protein
MRRFSINIQEGVPLFLCAFTYPAAGIDEQSLSLRLEIRACIMGMAEDNDVCIYLSDVPYSYYSGFL